jgi:Bacteriophage Sf6, terminase small subunit-like
MTACVCHTARFASEQRRWCGGSPLCAHRYDVPWSLRRESCGRPCAIEIANNCRPGMARKAKLQIDARKWILSRMMPKSGGGRQG